MIPFSFWPDIVNTRATELHTLCDLKFGILYLRCFYYFILRCLAIHLNIHAGCNNAYKPFALMDRLSLNSASFCTTEYLRVLRTKELLSAAELVFFTVEPPIKRKRLGLKYSQIFKLCTNFHFSLCYAKKCCPKNDCCLNVTQTATGNI